MPKSTHVLYRFFDAQGNLLYVGITNDPEQRFRGHQGDKSWYHHVATAKMEHFETRAELMAAEIAAIEGEKPKYNKTYAVSPLQSVRVRENTQAVSVFGGDASRFRSPDSIACDEPEEPADDEPLRLRIPIPCNLCHAPAVFREHDDLVRCDSCLNMWLWDEWRELNLLLPNEHDTRAS